MELICQYLSVPRIEALVKNHQLKGVGDLSNMRASEVCLANQQKPNKNKHKKRAYSARTAPVTEALVNGRNRRSLTIDYFQT